MWLSRASGSGDGAAHREPRGRRHEGGTALGAQAGPKKLVHAFRAAGFGHAGVATSTAYNLVIEAHA